MAAIMVVANQTLGCPELEQALASRLAEGGRDVVVVAPVAEIEGEQQWDYPPVDRYIPNPLQIAHALAAGRLQRELENLRSTGVTATGEVVDHDPVARVQELLAASEFDLVLVCTLPERFSRWLRRDLPRRLAHATDIPVQHVPGSAGPSI
jgi:hypothetical protein